MSLHLKDEPGLVVGAGRVSALAMKYLLHRGDGRKGSDDGSKLLARRELDSRVGLKISLAGRVSIVSDRGLIGEERLHGRQGRLVFAYLVSQEGRPVTRDELADALWGDTPPAKWEKALGVLA